MTKGVDSGNSGLCKRDKLPADIAPWNILVRPFAGRELDDDREWTTQRIIGWKLRTWIGRLDVHLSYRSSKASMGRFGGGWNWKLGIQGSRTNWILSLLIAELRLHWWTGKQIKREREWQQDRQRRIEQEQRKTRVKTCLSCQHVSVPVEFEPCSSCIDTLSKKSWEPQKQEAGA